MYFIFFLCFFLIIGRLNMGRVDGHCEHKDLLNCDTKHDMIK